MAFGKSSRKKNSFFILALFHEEMKMCIFCWRKCWRTSHSSFWTAILTVSIEWDLVSLQQNDLPFDRTYSANKPYLREALSYVVVLLHLCALLKHTAECFTPIPDMDRNRASRRGRNCHIWAWRNKIEKLSMLRSPRKRKKSPVAPAAFWLRAKVGIKQLAEMGWGLEISISIACNWKQIELSWKIITPL